MDEHRGRGSRRGRGRDERFGPPFRPGGRMRRGDIRTAVLAVLAEEPGHGYEVMQRLEDKTDGAWRPSPGSVYPTLQQLEDEGLVQATERDGKRTFELTDAGRAEAVARLEEAGGAPWEHHGHGRGPGELRASIMQLHLAVKQLTIAGNPEQLQRATAILKDARKQVYAILAED